MKKDQAKRLVELANILDEKGMRKEADEIDKVVKGQEVSRKWVLEEANFVKQILQEYLQKTNTIVDSIPRVFEKNLQSIGDSMVVIKEDLDGIEKELDFAFNASVLVLPKPPWLVK